MNKYKVSIIVNQFNAHNQHKLVRFFEEAQDLNLDLEVVVNDGTLAKIVDGNVVTSINSDYVIYLDKDIYLARMLEKAGITIFPDPNFLKICDDKMYTYIALTNEGVDMPLTMSSPLVFSDSLKEENYKFLDEVISTIGLPLVVKKVYGSLGRGVYLVNTKEELVELYNRFFNEPLLFQTYIKSSYGRSIRVLIIDGKIFGAFERYNPSDFRSNYGVNATSKNIILNKKYVGFVENIVQILDIKYAGIDLLYGENDNPILCEINSNAFFNEFEKVTGKNAAKAYLEMTRNLYEEENKNE